MIGEIVNKPTFQQVYLNHFFYGETKSKCTSNVSKTEKPWVDYTMANTKGQSWNRIAVCEVMDVYNWQFG